MSGNAIYEAIAKRTGGDVYVGVVGPVRSGKSTFIHSFMDSVVIPNIENEYDKERALDEIPQSGSCDLLCHRRSLPIPNRRWGLSFLHRHKTHIG